MTLTRAQIIDVVKLKCEELDPVLICAIIEQESDFEPWSYRYEPGFLRRYVVNLNLPDLTEAEGRSFSWGLMQTMGQSVREIGYTGPLPQLCEPETGIYWGCKLFRYKLIRANHDVKTALNYWNGGGNPHYPDEVLARLGKFIPTDPQNKTA